MNNWDFTGNLGRDAESRYLPNGDPVVNFSVAVKSGYGDKEKTTWAKCAMWGKRGEAVAPYLNKGQLVGVSGEITLREYTDKDGAVRASLEVRVNDLTLLGGKPGDKHDSEGTAPGRNGTATPRTQPNQGTDSGGSSQGAHVGSFDDLESDYQF